MIKSAKDLQPGDRFWRKAHEKVDILVTVEKANHLDHRTSVLGTDGEWYIYFPTAQLVMQA